MQTGIHATAIIDPMAELAADVSVGPYAVVGAGVTVGQGTRIGPHCTLEGPTTIGRDNVIRAHAAIGGAPQDMKYRGEPTQLHIGDRNTIGEFSTFNRGTTQDSGVTRVGDDNWVMAYVHVAHDVQLGSHTILANNATLAGHVHIGDWVIVGGLTGVHQFCHVGAHAMLGFQSRISQDVPPFMMIEGNPPQVRGVNVEGLRRRGFSRERIALVKQMHRLLYRDGLTLDKTREAIAALPGVADDATGTADEARRSTTDMSDEMTADVQMMLTFLAASTRGIAR